MKVHLNNNTKLLIIPLYLYSQVGLIVTAGGPNFTLMLSQFDDCVHQSECYFNRDQQSHDLVDKDRWRTITHERPDAYSVICEAFNMGPVIKAKIEDNSADPTHRFSDVLHHLYHSDNSIMWEKITTQIITIDEHLAEVIRNSIPQIHIE